MDSSKRSADQRYDGDKRLKLHCNECSNVRSPSQAWWCRTCLKTVCTQCNLFNHHTEHRSSPWSSDEMAQSLLVLFHGRKASREQRAAQEEAAIKEYMKRVESYFLRKLTKLTKQKDLLDHQIVSQVCKSINYDPDGALSAKDDNFGTSSPILAISKLLDDAKFERLIEEMNHLFNLNLNISECRRAIYSDDNPKHSVLPSLEPDIFAKNLERDLATTGTSSPYFLNGLLNYDEEPRKSDYNRSKSIPIDAVARNGTQNSSEQAKFTRSKSEAKNVESLRKEFFLPIEPKISILNETKIGIDDSGSDLDITDSSSRIVNGHSRQRTSSPDSITMDQNERHDVPFSNSIPTPIVLSPSKRTRNRPLSSMSHKANRRLKAKPNSDQISLPDNKNVSTLSLAGSHTDAEQCKVTAFSFGDGYLTRPIDVCALPNALLAVSDSCGGVYITTRMGHIVHRIVVEGGSASSIGFSRLKQLLFVGILKRSGRSINVYEIESYDLVTTIPCPVSPMIDITRSRWLCLTPGGDLYIVSGDNNVSALWRYSSAENNWITILTAPGTRYQYLDFMEQNELDDVDRPTVTLLTCECLLGSLILLTIKDDRLLSQIILQSIYRIQDHIFSPASAVRDQFANLLILDYANNGKLFLFEAPESDRTKNRRLKLLMEIGSQEGMGLCVEDGWCYVVCVNKKRVKAIQYKEI